MSSTVDDTPEHAEIVEKTKRGPNTYANYANMFFYVREICFFITIAVTSYAAIHNAPPLVSQIIPAVPFFNQNSHIIDFFNGELSPAFEKISESDLTFVMYYAPWDAESQVVKAEFDLLASYYSDEVHFIAVNCWHPVGECRRQFNKVHHFPVLIAYPSIRSKGIQYRGIKKAYHMARFLKVVLRPLTRVETSSDVLRLIAKHDAVVVSCVDMSSSKSGYQAVYTSALRALERDPFQEVSFAVATSRRTCMNLDFDDDIALPSAKLHLWNETIDYQGEWMSDNLVKWVFGNIHQVTVWVTLPGSKSMSLSPYVEEGPALLMFTPRNPFFTRTPYFDLLREIGLEYYNCNNNTLVTSLAQHLASERTTSKMEHRNDEKLCFTPISKGDNYCPRTTKAPTCATVTLPAAINYTISSKVLKEKTQKLKWDTSCEDANQRLSTKLWKAENCLVPLAEETSMPLHSINTTSITVDPKVLSLGKTRRDQKCKRLLLGRRLHVPVFPKKSANDGIDFSQLHGLSCSNNRSLSLLALDSLEFDAFAKYVGVDTSRMPDRTAVVIFNAATETSNLLTGPISKVTLSEFLVNHTSNTLTRSIRNFHRDEYDNACPSGSFCIPELNTTNFLPTVLNDSEDVVVLYHSPLCGMCGSASLTFLTIARLFQKTSNLRFVRIDGENNDLPWQYTMDSYPTILFFPAQRKSESRIFPKTQVISVETLTHFVLANLRPESRLQSLLSLHGSKKLARLHTLTALKSLATQCRLLKQKKSTMLTWRRLKQRSQYLRLLHLALNNSSLEPEATTSLNRYYRLSSKPLSSSKNPSPS